MLVCLYAIIHFLVRSTRERNLEVERLAIGALPIIGIISAGQRRAIRHMHNLCRSTNQSLDSMHDVAKEEPYAAGLSYEQHVPHDCLVYNENDLQILKPAIKNGNGRKRKRGKHSTC
eukprot:5561808-Amphidinium_carterae.1